LGEIVPQSPGDEVTLTQNRVRRPESTDQRGRSD